MSAHDFPSYRGNMFYRCLGCAGEHGIDELLYTCPRCGEVLLLEDRNFPELQKKGGAYWRDLFDARAAAKRPALRGIFRFYEITAPVPEEEDIIYLGEGNTPLIEASPALRGIVGRSFAYKNDGQNPSASFKDRGMACAFSYLRALMRKHAWDEVLTVCASTGDTSASAALYAAYAGGPIKSVVLLPQGKVTPQQLSQPLGGGARVLELPGVFDDCMKVVEFLAARYRVALLNSKNSWRILGQESYAFELAQARDWNMDKVCVFVPIGNAGNITAVLRGFLKLHLLGVIDALPRVFGVQSHHADPVYRYYATPAQNRAFRPVRVAPSAAQAAMIGNPVSFPRVRALAEQYRAVAGERAFQVLRVTEQAIMDCMLLVNRHGHTTCTQGGECAAGLCEAIAAGLVDDDEYAVLDSTAHALKFMDFQALYFADAFPPEYGIRADPALVNAPEILLDPEEKEGLDEKDFVRKSALRIASRLDLIPIPDQK
ncbi:MAG: threonine synthase [Desulfovibrio sp.]|jgi:threonine synthase|nr:threonine synthase [Desulfovibrio sp.]